MASLMASDQITTVTGLMDELYSASSKFSIADLRHLSFLRDQKLPGAGIVSCSAVRSLARDELKRRGAWRVKDSLLAAVFSLIAFALR